MVRNKYWLTIAILACIFILSLSEAEESHAFIAREYSLQEVLDACSNVAFGKVESVDQKRKRFIMGMEEYLKGAAEFSQIKVNVAVGQRVRKSTPEMLMKRVEAGLPVIMFYQHEKNSLNGLAYVSGTWFQIFGDNKKDKNKIWWRFTHIEIHMHRTFTGTTEEFQAILRARFSGEKWPTAREGDIKALVLTGNGVKPDRGQTTNAEFRTLRKINSISGRKVAYQETSNKNLNGLDDAHILWIGVDEMGFDGYQINNSTAGKIKNFVKNGGIAIVSSQDSDTGKLCGNSWIPEHIKGVDIQPQKGFKATKDAGDIFSKPKVVKSEAIHLDDTWMEWNNKYKILATTNDGKSIALAELPYGKGMYLVTALQNETEQMAKANAPMIENIMNFTVKEAIKRLPPESVASKSRVKALVLTGNGTKPVQGGPISTAEFLALKKFRKVDKWEVTYQATKDRNLSDLKNFNMLWIGVDEIGRDGYHLKKAEENKIKDFVKQGGVVIVSSQDSDTGKSYSNGWLPEPIKGVEESSRSDFKPTKDAGDIFNKPKKVASGSVDMDDTWTNWSNKYKVLATTNGGKNIAIAMLEYGKGMYIVTALINESEENVRTNAALMENIVYFSVKWLKTRSG